MTFKPVALVIFLVCVCQALGKNTFALVDNCPCVLALVLRSYLTKTENLGHVQGK